LLACIQFRPTLSQSFDGFAFFVKELIMDDKRVMLRHFLAALAYRTQKALRGAPESFFSFQIAPKVRTPLELV
jgi:hypothetical protein